MNKNPDHHRVLAAEWYMARRQKRFKMTHSGRKPVESLKLYPTIESVGQAGTLPLSSLLGILWNPERARP